jgi:fructose-specific phosphotransferase system IIB component
MRMLAVTACPTGTALTYMAANRLASAARALGYEIKIETQGAMGVENVLTPKDIARADIVILAADVEVDKAERFAKSRSVRVSTAEAVEKPDAVLKRAAGLIAGENADGR